MTRHLARILVYGYKEMIKRYRELPAFRGLRIYTVNKQADAPQTLPELRKDLEERAQLVVALEHGESSIYGGAKENAWFRAFHDLGHLVYNREMAYADEVQLAITQWYDLEPVFAGMGADDNLLLALRRLYLIDTVGQSRYCLITGRFPRDQSAFADALHAVLGRDAGPEAVLRGVDMLAEHGLFPSEV